MNREQWRELGRLIKYLLFSVSAGLIQIVSFALLRELLPWDFWVCYLLALALSVLWNFTLNRRFTFHAAANVPVAMGKVAAYYAVFALLTTLLGHYLVTSPGWNPYLVTGGGIVLNFITGYWYQRLVVYDRSSDSQE